FSGRAGTDARKGLAEIIVTGLPRYSRPEFVVVVDEIPWADAIPGWPGSPAVGIVCVFFAATLENAKGAQAVNVFDCQFNPSNVPESLKPTNCVKLPDADQDTI